MGNLGYGVFGLAALGLGILAFMALFSAAPWWWRSWMAVLILLLIGNLYGEWL